MDRKPRSSEVREENGALKRLIRLAQRHRKWALGFEEENWWSGYERANLRSWREAGQSMRVVEKEASKDDADPEKSSSSAIDST